MDNNKKRRRDDSRKERNRQEDPSSNDTRVTSAEETPDALVRREKEDIVINIFNEVKKIRKQLNKLTRSHRELCKQLESINVNGSSGDDSATPRSELNQGNDLKYRLKIDCQVNETIDKGQIIETSLGKTIRVILCNDQDEIVRTEPLCSAKVMLVVVNGDFNQHGDHDCWSQKDFERNIRRPQQGNSVTEDINQPVQSIVSNCIFRLAGGEKNHSDATILYNSRKQKVKLGVMVLWPTEERVLEGLSNPFKVRDPVKRGKKRLNPSAVEPSAGPSVAAIVSQAPFCDLTMRRTSINQPPCGPTGLYPSAIPLENSGTTFGHSAVPHAQEQDSILPLSGLTMLDTNTNQATYSQHAGRGHNLVPNEVLQMPYETANPNAGDGDSSVPNEVLQMLLAANANGMQFTNHIVNPALIIHSWPLDHLMPLYSRQPKCNNYGLLTMRLMKEHSGPLTIIPKAFMHTRRRTGVLIEPLEPDDSDEEGPLKRRLNGRYRLRFVNSVCKAYYTGEKIKADDGELLKVSLFDENNTRITSGPLSSAYVEVVVLHGDFNVDGQDYWTSEEFSRNIACPGPGKVRTVLGGNRIIILADGEACLGDSFFQVTSICARTGKFKMGVMMASAREDRIQEGISDPFLVMEERRQKDLPSGFRFHPTDTELILHYLRNRAASLPCPIAIIADVDIYMFDPWDLPCKAVYGYGEWYFFSPHYLKYPKGIRPNRSTASGYWKATGTDKPIHDSSSGELIGVKKALVFYKGRPPRGTKTNWFMQEYRLLADTTHLQHWVLCKIYKKMNEPQLLSVTAATDLRLEPGNEDSIA